MIVLSVAFVAVVAGVFGAFAGHHIAATRTGEALKLARYTDAIEVLKDLVNTPDARDLRPRAGAVLNAHRQATKES